MSHAIEPASALRTFTALRDRLDSGKDAEPGPELSFRAASVTLRYGGQLAGRSTAQGELAAERALSGALAQTPNRLGLTRDALLESRLRELTPGLTLSVELAHRFVPLSEREFETPDAALAPGLVGLAARVGNGGGAGVDVGGSRDGEERWAIAFPERMLESVSTPGSTLLRLAGEALDEPVVTLEELARAVDSGRLVMYRFEVTHVAQTEPREPGSFLHRGGRVIQESEVTSAALRRAAADAAAHLIGRCIDAETGRRLISTWHPVQRPAEGDSASATSHLLAARAMLRYAGSHVAQPALARECRANARRLLEHLGSKLDPAIGLAPEQAALALAVLSELGGAEGPHERRLLEASRRSLADLAVMAVVPGATPAEALRLWATIASEPDEARRAGYASQLASLLATVAPERQVGLMPWAGWGLLAGGGPVRSLAPMRDLVHVHQLTWRDLSEQERDLVGGVVFTRGETPLPSWHTLRPLGFLAAALRDPMLTPEGRRLEDLSRLLTSLRFAMQLQVGQAEARVYAQPRAALGGVRSAPWDFRLPADATSLALLTYCEALESLAALASPRAPVEMPTKSPPEMPSRAPSDAPFVPRPGAPRLQPEIEAPSGGSGGV